ncbi:MAG: class F sortase [Candidatus Paceibacterota bacterium]
MNKESLIWRITLLIFVFVLFAGGTFYINGVLNKPFMAVSSTTADQLVDMTEYEPEEFVSALPTRLLIPAIGINANIEYVGITDDGTEKMDVPSNLIDVGWYKHGVRPGMRGSAVIAGHLNGKYTPHAVFSNLHRLEIGDKVHIINEQQLKETFYVVKIETYAHDALTTDVFVSTDGKARLNLITCSGNWLAEEDVYSKRTVVFTERVIESQ